MTKPLLMSLSVDLSPTPGFCVKSSSLQPGVFTASERTDPTKPSLKRIPIPIGFKIFVNVCYDANVPPPPPASQDVIQRAMQGTDVDEVDPSAWFVPVIVSEGCEVTDKGKSPDICQ